MKPIEATACLALAITALSAGATPLDGWRHPFARIAAQRGEIASSPSGLFWDDLRRGELFDDRLWPDSTAYAGNHWTLEPAVGGSYDSDGYPDDKNTNLQFDLLSDFAFGPFTVRTVLDVEEQFLDHGEYVWHSGRGAAGRIDEAYVQYSGAHGFARLGRLNRTWGPFMDRSILLSDHPFTYDAFEWQLHVPFLEFRHLFAAFPLAHSDTDVGIRHHYRNRYLTAHALNFIFGEWAALGISETVLFSRDKGFPDLQYVNPVGIYTVTNTNHEGSGNLMLGLQGWAHPFTKRVTLKGQLVFDDVQVDNEDKGDQEPMHWACDVGGYWNDPLPIPLSHHLAVEYRYLSKWLYTVNHGNTRRGERYTYLGRGLGYPGVDGDELSASVTAVGDNYWAASVGFGFARQDTNTLWTRWDQPDTASSSLGYRRETPLSKRTNVSTTISVPLEAHAYFRDFVALHLTLDNRWVQNPDHDRSDGFAYDPRIFFTLTAHYSDFFLHFGRKKTQKP